MLCGKSHAREHNKPLDPLPHCQIATTKTARRAEPVGADAAPRRPAGGADAAKPYRGAGGRAVSVAAAAPSALTLARSA